MIYPNFRLTNERLLLIYFHFRPSYDRFWLYHSHFRSTNKRFLLIYSHFRPTNDMFYLYYSHFRTNIKRLLLIYSHFRSTNKRLYLIHSHFRSTNERLLFIYSHFRGKRGIVPNTGLNTFLENVLNLFVCIKLIFFLTFFLSLSNFIYYIVGYNRNKTRSRRPQIQF